MVASILDQVKYVYTECDTNNGRWKVAVPKKPGLCTLKNPHAPERGTKCTFACPEGQFLDIATQKCKECDAGTFSLSGGLRFQSWKKLPNGFDTWGFNPDESNHSVEAEKRCKSSSLFDGSSDKQNQGARRVRSLLYAP
eukprot:gene6301-7023_t